MREIVAVYQDCVLCGVKGRMKIAEYANKGISIKKVGFATPEGRELCAKAVSMGIGSMPFYVDEEKQVFSVNIDELLKNTDKKTVKKQKKARKHGTNAKNKND